MIFLPTNLRHLRETRGLTQMQLAEMIGVRPNTVSNYENGNSSPDFEVLGEIVKVLDTDAHSLLYKDLRSVPASAPPRRVSDISGFYDTDCRECGPSDSAAADSQQGVAGTDYDRRLSEMALEIDKLKEMVLVLQQKLGI